MNTVYFRLLYYKKTYLLPKYSKFISFTYLLTLPVYLLVLYPYYLTFVGRSVVSTGIRARLVTKSTSFYRRQSNLIIIKFIHPNKRKLTFDKSKISTYLRYLPSSNTKQNMNSYKFNCDPYTSKVKEIPRDVMSQTPL